MEKLWSIKFGDLVKELKEAQVPSDIRGIDLSKSGVKAFYDDERKLTKLVIDMKYLTDEDYDETMDVLKEVLSYLEEGEMRLITQFSEEPESEQ